MVPQKMDFNQLCCFFPRCVIKMRADDERGQFGEVFGIAPGPAPALPIG